MRRHEILAKPHWQPHAASPVLLSLPLDELRALDSLVVFAREQGRPSLTGADCRTWARLNGGLMALEYACRAMEATEGSEAAELAALDAAHDDLSACARYAAITRIPRRSYERSLSVPFDQLPILWQTRLIDIRGRRDDGDLRIENDLLDRMTQKLGQYAWYMQEIAVEVEFTIDGLHAYYQYETTRISSRGGPLSPSTILATFSDFQNFMKFSRGYPKPLIKEVGKLLVKLRDRADKTNSAKFAALAKIDSTTILPRAERILQTVERFRNPAQRHIQRNRSMALALPLLTPLRREWHELVFGRDLVWADGRYRLRDYRLRKTRHRPGRENYPGSIHPSHQKFVDAVLLQDDDPRYLHILRAGAEADHWPLFRHPDGSCVAANYVSQVWSTEYGTGATISRSLIYDILFALGEEATLGGTFANDHTSRQARENYIGQAARGAGLAAAAKEIDDIADLFDVADDRGSRQCP